MPWLRAGDNLSTHPKMFRLLEACGYDHDLKNAAFGALVISASVAAAHLTDYVIEPGLIATFAPTQPKRITDALMSAALLEEIDVEGRRLFRIVEDEDFLHMRSKEEVEIDRRRSADKRNHELIISVRVRDGDVCRWCGRTVNWNDRRGTRGGEYDSLSSHKDSTTDTLVVSCKGCNSKRKDGHELQLRPEPTREEVYYTPSSISWINSHPWAQENNITVSDRQTRLDLGQAAAAGADVDGQAAASTAAPAAPTAPAQAAPAPSTPPPVGPRDDLADAPDWVTAPINEIIKARPAASGHDGVDDQAAATTAAPTDQAAALTAAPADQGARGQQAPEVEASEGQAAAPDHDECNEMAKPSSDLDREGDGPGLVGSGRDGKGRTGEWSVLGQGRKRKRGRRSGRRR
ncbi:hypothetical protein EAH68_12745 [Corynebacterium hylobatis]|uniref:HNH endonuclease n=1 Tax=Corynebacterium hylobatis TaxID=1859290 RepID=A0A430HVS0_9CORY|nr:hypothetical protein [Corynebacterium hylobatis]RSZ61527.1 hypothetical protein EAH68_12745 [Corynebacterium hylobatis]